MASRNGRKRPGKPPAGQGAGPTWDEVQEWHDVLWQVVMGKVPSDADEDTRKIMSANLDVLCAVLGHTHNTTFRDNMAGLMAELESIGYVLQDTGRPVRKPEWEEGT